MSNSSLNVVVLSGDLSSDPLGDQIVKVEDGVSVKGDIMQSGISV